MIKEYKALITTDHYSAILSCADYKLTKDELLILELTSDNRVTIYKARIDPHHSQG